MERLTSKRDITYTNKWGHEFRLLAFSSIDDQVKYLVQSKGLFFNTSAHGFAEMHFDEHLSQIYYNAKSPFLPDGVWSVRKFKDKSVLQVPGWDLVSGLLPVINEKDWRLHVIGASDEIVTRLQAKYPRLRITADTGIIDVNKYPTEVGFSLEGCDCVLICLGSPKQDILAANLIKTCALDALVIPIGIALAIEVGLESRVPEFYRKNGLAWFHRAIKNPGKMYPRIIKILRFKLFELWS